MRRRVLPLPGVNGVYLQKRETNVIWGLSVGFNLFFKAVEGIFTLCKKGSGVVPKARVLKTGKSSDGKEEGGQGGKEGGKKK